MSEDVVCAEGKPAERPKKTLSAYIAEKRALAEATLATREKRRAHYAPKPVAAVPKPVAPRPDPYDAGKRIGSSFAALSQRSRGNRD